MDKGWRRKPRTWQRKPQVWKQTLGVAKVGLAVVLSLLLWAPFPLQAQQQPVEEVGDSATESPSERLSFLVDRISLAKATDSADVLLYGQEALRLLDQRPDPQLRLRVLAALCHAQNLLFHYHDAIEIGRQAEELARRLGADQELAAILTDLGKATRRLSEHRSSIVFFLEAIGLYEKLGDSKGVATASTGTGHVYWRLGQYPKALTYFLRAQESYAEAQDQKGVGGTLRNIANLYYCIRQPKQALRLYQQALELQQELGNERSIGMIHAELGDVYLALGEPSRALDYFLLAQESFEQRGFQAGRAEVFNGMGNVYRESGEVDHAVGFYESALRIRRQIGDRKQQARTLIELATAEMARGGHQLALDQLQEALSLAVETEAKREILEAHQGLSSAYAGLDRYQEALEASDAGQAIERELFNADRQSEFDDIFARFEAEKAEREARRKEQAIEESTRRLGWIGLASVASTLALVALAILKKAYSNRPSARSREEEPQEPSGREAELENRCAQLEFKIAELESLNQELAIKTPEMDDEVPSLVFGVEASLDSGSKKGEGQNGQDRSSCSVVDSGGRTMRDLVFPEGYLPGESAAIQAMYQALRPLLGAELTVLIEGETGAGKEGVAQILHLSSKRRKGPFVAVNCAAIPADLLEAEMFGIGKGVATGVSSRSGRFLAAEGGTLFLDEVSEMPLELQAKLLRAVQERKIQPVGSGEIPVDVWVIAASNQDLLQRSEDGLFRRDLYYRLAGFVLKVPPLRDRLSDLLPLFQHFLQQTLGKGGKDPRGLTEKAQSVLLNYPWPGNIRELEHEVKHLALLAESGQTIDSSMLSERFAIEGGATAEPRRSPDFPGSEASPGGEGASLALKDQVQKLENQVILEALRVTEGNQSKASQLLGISRSTLARKISGLGIPT